MSSNKRVWKIYVVTHKDSGRRYVGQTIREIVERWRLHCAPNSGCVLLRNAIQKHGEAAFDIEWVASCCTKEAANQTERYLISEGQTTDRGFGYNVTTGGEGHARSEFCLRGHNKEIAGVSSSGGCLLCRKAARVEERERFLQDPLRIERRREYRKKYQPRLNSFRRVSRLRTYLARDFKHASTIPWEAFFCL